MCQLRLARATTAFFIHSIHDLINVSLFTSAASDTTYGNLIQTIYMRIQRIRKVNDVKNTALSALEPFIGEWKYTMYNC